MGNTAFINWRRGRRLATVSIAAATVAVAITGCSTHPGTNTAAAGNLPAKNISQWVMPLDQYIQTEAESHAHDYAEALLQEPCMAKSGYAWNVPWQDTSSFGSASLNAAGRSVFNPSLAGEWGYHLAPTTDTSLAAWHAWEPQTINLSASEQSTFDSCLQQSRKQLPLLPGNDLNFASGLGQSAFEDAQHDSKVTAAAAKWRQCMAPAGVSDLPQTPATMPSDSVVHEFGIDNGQIPVAAPIVSAAEKKLAVMDANCRVSSGYQQAAYTAEWDAQVALVGKNADQLSRVASALKKNNAQVAAVVAAHAPKH
jgi:hypothetical protein